MTNKFCFEALDKSLRDIMLLEDKENNKPFSGLIAQLGGVFRQILPIVPKGRQGDIIEALIT